MSMPSSSENEGMSRFIRKIYGSLEKAFLTSSDLPMLVC